MYDTAAKYRSADIDVSIIIVSWNTCDILRDCLASIYLQSGAIEYEIIVVDNASGDGSVDMVKKEFPQVVLLSNNENKGFASANNQGMAIGRGRYVLLLNSDTLILDKAIEKTISFADSDSHVAVTGCRVLNPDRTLQTTCFMYPSLLNMFLSSTYLYKLFAGSHFFGREQMTWWKRDDVREVDVATGCFMLVRREALNQVGMMDEQFFMYGEETDWCYRFKQAGWHILFMPDAEIIHLGGQSSRQVQAEMLVQLRISILQFMRKHYCWLTFRIACLLTVMFWALRVPIWFCIGLLSQKRRKKSILRTSAYLLGIKKAFLY